MLRKYNCMTAVLLLIFCGMQAKLSFDVQDKNIGFNPSPNPISPGCLADEAVPGSSTTIYHGAAVEPTIAINPQDKHQIVAGWQQDRTSNGGAVNVGIKHSENGGKDWQQSTLSLQNCNGGIIDRSSDVWLSYAADGSRVFMTVLLINSTTDPNTLNQNGIITTFSTDNGATWSIPHFVDASATTQETEFTASTPFDDKPSITADPLIPNNAYVVWDKFDPASSFHSDTWFSRTTDGGLSWEPSRLIYNPFLDPGLVSNGIENDCSVVGNIIVGLPNGDLLCFMARDYAKPEVNGVPVTDIQFMNDVWPYQFSTFDIAVIRSTDHGDTWTQTATQVAIQDQNNVFTCGYTYDVNCNVTGQVLGGENCRVSATSALYDVAVNPKNGNLYVVWGDSRFNVNSFQEIALARSRDGGFTWSDPVQVNQTPSNAPNPQAFTPAVAINEKGHLGILYHDFRKSNVQIATCTTPGGCTDQTKTNAWFDLYKEVSDAFGGSTGVGLDFKDEVRVSHPSYFMENGPNTTQGIMTNGDYAGVKILPKGDDFHLINIQSHRGPFAPAQTVSDNIETGILILDDNYRTSPFFSKIDG